ncbi:MAG: hypothetical protein GY805_12610 [Chloroflexi bacterium]|nr:hypothetical protein [Chloroflexota bacterium]
MNKLNLQEIEQNARQVFNKDGLMYLFLVVHWFLLDSLFTIADLVH